MFLNANKPLLEMKTVTETEVLKLIKMMLKIQMLKSI